MQDKPHQTPDLKVASSTSPPVDPKGAAFLELLRSEVVDLQEKINQVVAQHQQMVARLEYRQWTLDELEKKVE